MLNGSPTTRDYRWDVIRRQSQSYQCLAMRQSQGIMDLSNSKARQPRTLETLKRPLDRGAAENTAGPVQSLSCGLPRAPCPGQEPPLPVSFVPRQRRSWAGAFHPQLLHFKG